MKMLIRLGRTPARRVAKIFPARNCDNLFASYPSPLFRQNSKKNTCRNLKVKSKTYFSSTCGKSYISSAAAEKIGLACPRPRCVTRNVIDGSPSPREKTAHFRAGAISPAAAAAASPQKKRNKKSWENGPLPEMASSAGEKGCK